MIVSVVIPCFNGEKTIVEAINSVIDQSYANLEIIVVDDCSNDGSRDLIAQIDDSRLVFIKHEKNLGVAAARNTAISKATGDFIAFLDADDVWYRSKIERQLQWMSMHNEALSCTSFKMISSRGQKEIVVRECISYRSLLKSNAVLNSSLMYDITKLGRHYLESVGHEDYNLLLDIFSKYNLKIHPVPEVLVTYNNFGGGVSRNKLKAIGWSWKVYSRQESLSFLERLYYFSHNVIRGVRKHYL